MILLRMHVPEELAVQMIGLDDEEKIFIKCPRNMEIADRGIEALDKEGYNFKAMKGGGQGDKPSPLYWVAVMDTLLCALRDKPSGFRVQDLDGNTYPGTLMTFNALRLQQLRYRQRPTLSPGGVNTLGLRSQNQR